MYHIETLTDLRPTQVLLGMGQKIADDSAIIDDIVTIGQSIGLEVDVYDIEEFLEDYSIKLTTEELKHLQNEQEKIG